MSCRLCMGALLALACLAGAGCQSMRHSDTPIVGDSMSLGMGCGPAGCGGVDPSSVGYDDGYVDEGMAVGCAGSTCDGRCGGRCPLAGRGMALRDRAGNLIRNRPHPLAAAIDCSHRHCANGACGGAVGPETGSVTYPYYTLRGPRDFLLNNPPSIGP